MDEHTLTVEGMSCAGCESNVKTTLEALEGVSSATANHDRNEVRVTHETSVVDVPALGGAIEDAGYDVVE